MDYYGYQFWVTKGALFRESGMSYPSPPWLNLHPPSGKGFYLGIRGRQ